MADEVKKEAPANFKVTIDNITIEVAPGTTILHAARQIGGDVTPPAMCYYSKLQGSGGKCRTCKSWCGGISFNKSPVRLPDL